MPDWLWERIDPLLPARPLHPLGCHRPRVADRDAMDAILLVLRTGMQWNALNATGICSSSSAHRRFLEWSRPACSTRSGGKGCSTTTSRSGSTGPGCPVTAQAGKHRSEVRRPARIPLIEQKGGETFASLRGGRGPGRGGA